MPEELCGSWLGTHVHSTTLTGMAATPVSCNSLKSPSSSVTSWGKNKRTNIYCTPNHGTDVCSAGCSDMTAQVALTVHCTSRRNANESIFVSQVHWCRWAGDHPPYIYLLDTTIFPISDRIAHTQSSRKVLPSKGDFMTCGAWLGEGGRRDGKCKGHP